jgi:hypothetical protein
VSQKLVVSVDASQDGTELVTVQDVFMHVLELFQLVNDSDPMSQDKVAWRLISVTMNSPLTVTAEAVPRYPFAFIDDSAASQVTAFVSNYNELKEGRIPLDWARPEPKRLAGRLLARNRHIINRTIIKSIDGPPVADVEITSESAKFAEMEVLKNTPPISKVKDQIGTLEGKLLQVHFYYGQPAIQIIERKTKQEIWCVVPERFQHEISQSTSVEDVWRGSRVIVKGRISYGNDGKISRVSATSVKQMESIEISDNSIVDREFTGGLSGSEYLEKFRDGKLG